MANSKQIVYLSQAQYAELIANGSITVDGVTVTYDENDIYVTPQAEPVTDVRINGASITANGIANIPIADRRLGVIQVSSSFGHTVGTNGVLVHKPSADSTLKYGTDQYDPVVAKNEHTATFYGLAKAAGHDEKDSVEPLGTYTPEAKGAIQKMLGVSDLIATEENNLIASKAYAVGDVFTANGKLYKATAAIAVDGAIITDGDGANCEEVTVADGFVKFTDYATADKNGVIKVQHNSVSEAMSEGGSVLVNNVLYIVGTSPGKIKAGVDHGALISAPRARDATFYGLAKAAGADEKDSTLPVGQYTDTAKSAIRTMLGATSSNVIAVQDTQPTDTDTKIWLPETAETPVEVPTVAEMEAALAGKVGDVQVNGVSVVSNGIANVPIGGLGTLGVVKTESNSGLRIDPTTGQIHTVYASVSTIKDGVTLNQIISPGNQHQATFYGLAKAAGDTTQSASSNAVGTYTDEAKSAIRTMIGSVGDVQIDGTSVVTDGVASIPMASTSTPGTVIINYSYGIGLAGTPSALALLYAQTSAIKAGVSYYNPIVPKYQHESVFWGLAKAAGDTTQSASTNAVGTYTDNAKASIKAMLGIQDGSTGTVDVTGTTPTITAVENTRYVCGEVTSLSFTPPASGIAIVRFTSGTSVTVLTIPSTVKFPEWFDPTSLETETIYEICVTDGVYGAVMSWAL